MMLREPASPFGIGGALENRQLGLGGRRPGHGAILPAGHRYHPL
jgi:hypothetical protein